MNNEQLKQIWCQTYILEEHNDPRSVFAERLGVSRNEVKQKCYMILHTVPFLAQTLHAILDK